MKQPKRLPNVLIVDIFNDNISCSVVNFSQGPELAPVAILTVRSEIAFQEEETADRITANVFAAIEKTVIDVQKAMIAEKLTHRADMPRHAYCIVHSPLVISQTKILRTALPKPTLITRRLIENIMKNQKDTDDADGEADKSIEANGDRVLLESQIISFELNGYSTPTPYGKTADEIAITMHESFISKTILEGMRAKIHLHYQIPIEFHAMSLVYFSAIRDLNPTLEDFLMVSIDPLTSDVHIVKKGVLVQTISFPIGKNFFIKRVVEKLKVLPPMAVSKMRMYVDQTSTGDVEATLDPIFKKAALEWQKNFTDTLANVSEELFIPRLVFLKADPDLLPFFEKMIADQDFRQFSLTKQTFTVVPLDEDYIKKYNGIENDPALFLETSFINKVHNQSVA